MTPEEIIKEIRNIINKTAFDDNFSMAHMARQVRSIIRNN